MTRFRSLFDSCMTRPISPPSPLTDASGHPWPSGPRSVGVQGRRGARQRLFLFGGARRNAAGGPSLARAMYRLEATIHADLVPPEDARRSLQRSQSRRPLRDRTAEAVLRMLSNRKNEDKDDNGNDGQLELDEQAFRT